MDYSGPPRDRFYDIINKTDGVVNGTALVLGLVAMPIILYLGISIGKKVQDDLRQVELRYGNQTIEKKLETK